MAGVCQSAALGKVELVEVDVGDLARLGCMLRDDLVTLGHRGGARLRRHIEVELEVVVLIPGHVPSQGLSAGLVNPLEETDSDYSMTGVTDTTVNGVLSPSGITWMSNWYDASLAVAWQVV